MPATPPVHAITAVSHDYFTQRGGAERVAAALIKHFEPERVLTAVYDPPSTFAMGSDETVETSFIQSVAAFRRDPRRALPLLPLAWSMLRPVASGVVLCSSSGWAHGARVKSPAKKVVYCHNPARWLYQPEDFFKGQHPLLKILMRAIAPLLRRWDRHAALSADLYIANSRAVAGRIYQCYGLEPIVIHPPVSIETEGAQNPVEGIPARFFLTVGRARGYKNTERLVDAFRLRPAHYMVCVGDQPAGTTPPPNVAYTGRIDDAQLRWLYARATALVSVSNEDFGLTPIEANAFGTPALLIRAGGFLDSLAEGVSGRYLDDSHPTTIAAGLDAFPTAWDRDRIRAHAQTFSMDAFATRLDRAVASLFANESVNEQEVAA